MMSSIVLSMAWACALFFSLLFCPVSSVISDQPSTCVETPSCSPSDLAALRSMAAAFPPLFTSWPASAHNCCGHWGPQLTIICSFCFTPNTNHSSTTTSGVGRVTELLGALQIDFVADVISIPISLCSLSALTSLRLVGYYLISGPIPACIGNNLTHLVHLNLSKNGLTGSIPLSFSRLPSLQVLDLSENGLSGAFPSFLSHQLAYLDLHHNYFSGPIPNNLNSLTHLGFLDLGANSLSGPIPNPLNLTHLTSLDLTANAFSGPLPTLNTPKLVHLYLAGNSLTGSIPLSFSRLPSLQVLDLSENRLSGAFPAFLSHQLAYLDLNYNSFSGPIPNNLNSLTHLGFLRLGGNLLSGPIPNPLNLTHLTSFDLSDNAFSGPLPTLNTPKLVSLTLNSNHFSGSLSSLFQASNLTSLQSMRISDNQLKGVIPESICGLINLRILDLSSNAFSGQINTLEKCNFTKFEMLHMSENFFTGPFPDWLGSLSNLSDLSIAHNNLSGSLPDSWKNLTSLYSLELSGNSVLTPSKNLSAPKLPCWLFALPTLQDLYLSSMQLQAIDLAEICSSHCGISLLSSLDLSNNLFNPDILHCFSNVFQPPLFSPGYPMLNLSGNPLELDFSSPNALKLLPKSLGSLDLSFCKLGGQLTNLFFERLAPSVSFLYLAHNQLEGQIPAELGNMSQLEILDLSNNMFTGLNSPLTNGGHQWAGWNLDLSNNRLAGNLLSLLSRIVPNVSSCSPGFGCLRDLDLSHNFLTGGIPPFLFQCLGAGTQRLKLNHNHLNGSLPNVPFPLYLGVLSLSNNELSGQIPSSFRNLTNLMLLDLSHNRLEGNLENIPLFSNASSQQFHQLRVLLLGNNKFTGTIPPSLGDIAPALQLIDFSNNYLTGSIPVNTLQSLPAFKIMYVPEDVEVGGTLYEEIVMNVKGSEETYKYVLQALTALDLSSNKLSGPISTGMGELSGIVYLNLSRNNLSGAIPSDLGRLGQLESLDMSFNELAGPIPSSFQNLTSLAVFNVSYNKGLNGSIPPNNPQLNNKDSYIGDPKLCGWPNACPNPNVQHGTTSSQDEPHKSMNFVARWIDEWIAIPGLLLGTLVGFLGTLLALKAFKW